MEFTEVATRRRMTRRFRTTPAVPDHVVTRLVRLGPTGALGGLHPGVGRRRPHGCGRPRSLLVRDDRSRPRSGCLATRSGRRPGPAAHAGRPTAIPRPLCGTGQGWTDRSRDRWPIPYWDTDTAMAAMLILLGATDRGLGSLFFGVPAGRHDAVRSAFDIPRPTDRRRHRTRPRGSLLAQPLARQGRRPVPTCSTWVASRRPARRSEGPSPPFVKMQGSYAVRPPSELTEPHGPPHHSRRPQKPSWSRSSTSTCPRKCRTPSSEYSVSVIHSRALSRRA